MLGHELDVTARALVGLPGRVPVAPLDLPTDHGPLELEGAADAEREDPVTVTYTSDKSDGPTAGRHTFEAVEFVARYRAHPGQGHTMQRAGTRPAPTRSRGEAKQRWAELLRLVYEVDPLQCPKCGGQMRVIALIREPAVIDKILSTCSARSG